MKVNVTVFTLSLQAALEGFRKVADENGYGINMHSQEDYQTKKFEYYCLSFDAPHDSEALAWLHNSEDFKEDTDDLFE